MADIYNCCPFNTYLLFRDGRGGLKSWEREGERELVSGKKNQD
jgi:hypothetical protein